MSKKVCVFDVEANGIHPDKIWCLTAAVYTNGRWVQKTTTDYDVMRKFFRETDIAIGHNITFWDIPHLERILGIKIETKIVDTLGLSWYLYPNQFEHGLEVWGEFFGVPKPKIDNWEDLTTEEYIHRCEEDVKINCKLFDKQWKDLMNLYEEDKSEVWRLIDYIQFKLYTAAMAEKSRWKLDVDKCERGLAELELLKEEKVELLAKAMPKVPVYKKVNRPKTLFKADGTLSVRGQKWKDACLKYGYSLDREESIEYVESENEGNPNSNPQLKDWLESLGWIPETFDFKREGRTTRKIPQIRKEVKGEKVLCNSVKKLYDKEPALEALEGISVLTHRIGILRGFLKNTSPDGFIMAQVSGLTNTLRFKHKTIVNLPSVKKPYGKLIRGCLIAPEGYELVGSDMSSLEDRTKQHYMWDFDPEYVKEMQTDDFDPHLDLAVVAGFLTQEESDSHKRYSEYKNLWKNAVEAGDTKLAEEYKAVWEVEQDFGSERSKAKTANYACVYGASGSTVARGAGIPKEEGDQLVEKYWDRNWSVNAVAEAQRVKNCLGGMWLFNPISKFWYSLRFEKDRFSTLNQGSGVYAFDMWIKEFMEVRPEITGQMHDEVILTVKKGNREAAEKLLRDAIQRVNEKLNLNRDLDIDVQFGDSYAEIH